MNPLKAFRYFLWEQYKGCFAKFVILAVIGAIMGLFFYSMPVSDTRCQFRYTYLCIGV